MRTWLFLCAIGAVGLIPACKDSGGDEDCAPGAAGCPCSSGLCLGNMQCVANVCVDSAGSASTPSEPTTDTPTEPTTMSDDTGTAEPGGPVILQFLTNVNTISDGETVTFTAVVTDPDGVADVIGGSMSSPDGKIGYGAFVTGGEEGAYSLDLSWAQLHQAEAIAFDGPSTTRSFRAEFFDQGGKSASKTVEMTLSCDDGKRITPAVCEGSCTDLDSDDVNCTQCGIVCLLSFKTSGHCVNSGCTPALQGCSTYAEFANCDQQCASLGETCVVGGCTNMTSVAYADDKCGSNESFGFGHPCNEPADQGSGQYHACCCTQTI